LFGWLVCCCFDVVVVVVVVCCCCCCLLLLLLLLLLLPAIDILASRALLCLKSFMLVTREIYCTPVFKAFILFYHFCVVAAAADAAVVAVAAGQRYF